MNLGSGGLLTGLRLVAGVGLAVGAYVHLALAEVYGVGLESVTPLLPGNLFIAQAVVGFACAAWLAVSPSVRAWIAVLLVAGGSFAAVTISRYVKLPQLGPIPSLYEPEWNFYAIVSATAEALSAAACVCALALLWRAGGGPSALVKKK